MFTLFPLCSRKVVWKTLPQLHKFSRVASTNVRECSCNSFELACCPQLQNNTGFNLVSFRNQGTFLYPKDWRCMKNPTITVKECF